MSRVNHLLACGSVALVICGACEPRASQESHLSKRPVNAERATSRDNTVLSAQQSAKLFSEADSQDGAADSQDAARDRGAGFPSVHKYITSDPEQAGLPSDEAKEGKALAPQVMPASGAAPSAQLNKEPCVLTPETTNAENPEPDSPQLHARAAQLLQAIANDDGAAGDPFWFPRGPFVALKAIDDPGKYWEQLRRAYRADIHELHAQRKTWDDIEFVRFDVGSRPKWVEPGKEANRIGYYRSLHGQLHYRVQGKPRVVDVHTIITCQGRWYVTHLNAFKK